jgi:hypothetical protein
MEQKKKEDDREANAMLAGGATIAAIGIAGAVAGAMCPICVVAAPVLIGIGVTRKIRAARRRARPKDVPV